MADGDPGDWENGETETYEISTANWRARLTVMEDA